MYAHAHLWSGHSARYCCICIPIRVCKACCRFLWCSVELTAVNHCCLLLVSHMLSLGVCKNRDIVILPSSPFIIWNIPLERNLPHLLFSYPQGTDSFEFLFTRELSSEWTIGLLVSNRLIWSLIESNLPPLLLRSFVILTGLCCFPRMSRIWEQTAELRSQSSHCIDTAASGLTFDWVEPCVLVSQCNQGEMTSDCWHFRFLPSFPGHVFSNLYSFWRVLVLCQGIKPLCWGQEVFEHLNFFWSETPFLDKRTVKASAPLERLVLPVSWPGVSSDPRHCRLGRKFSRALARLKSLGCLGISYALYTWGLSFLPRITTHLFPLDGERWFHVDDAEFIHWLVHLANIYWASRVPSAGVWAWEGPSWSWCSRSRTQMIK